MTCANVASVAQTEEAPVDSTARRFIPTGIRVGTDLLAIGMSQFKNNFSGWEVAADVDFYRYYVVAEYGSSSVNEEIYNGYYSNSGSYFRIGIDVNFLFKDPDKNMFFLGGRFGRSSFSDEATYIYEVPEFPPATYNLSNPHVVGTWVELTTGLKVKIWKVLWLGATGRLKFGLDLDGNGNLTSYDVPGFGRNFKPSWWGLNYYALIRIPFRGQK